jgi:hypothetical protein
MNERWTRVRRALGFAVVAPLVFAASAVAQEPATTADSVDSCTEPTLEQPFSDVGDNRDYVLAPGGAFEDPTAPGWSLSGGAAVVDATDPLALGSSGDSNALSLPPGSSAVSPAMCVDLHYPTMRFVGAQLTDKNSGLHVEVLYPSSKKQEWDKAGTVKATDDDGWHATKDVDIRPEYGGKTAGWRLVALQFTAEDRGTWLIDDVFVDPRMK